MGYRLADIVTDVGVSAKNLNRHGVIRILDDVRRGSVDRIIVPKLDRLTRSIRDLVAILDLFAIHRVSLTSVSETLDTESAAGRMVVNMLAVVGQWEREVIAERTIQALAHKRRHGQAYGPTPFGYRRVGAELFADPTEKCALQELRSMSAAGASLREMAAALQRLGIRPRGQKWYPNSVRVILRSKMAREI